MTVTLKSLWSGITDIVDTGRCGKGEKQEAFQSEVKLWKRKGLSFVLQ